MMPLRWRRQLAAAGWLLGLLLALPSAHAVTITDDRGRALRFDQPPQRIVSLLPSLTESVCELQRCERLVGVDRYSNWPASVRRLPQVAAGWTRTSRPSSRCARTWYCCRSAAASATGWRRWA